MRIAWLPLIALLIGCQAHIFATGAQGEVKFSFDRLIKPRAIVVFEIENWQRGRLVCTLEPAAQDSSRETPPVDAWLYGKSIDGGYEPVACEPLVSGRRYGVMVYLPSRNEIATDFQILEDGSVVNLDVRSQ
jgi:hypothetical protein